MAEPSSYALVLIAYTAWNGIASPPTVTTLGTFTEDTCNGAIARSGKTREVKVQGTGKAGGSKPVVNQVSELRWSLLCVPTKTAGSE